MYGKSSPAVSGGASTVPGHCEYAEVTKPIPGKGDASLPKLKLFIFRVLWTASALTGNSPCTKSRLRPMIAREKIMNLVEDIIT
jgi:hypothetical protein